MRGSSNRKFHNREFVTSSTAVFICQICWPGFEREFNQNESGFYRVTQISNLDLRRGVLPTFSAIFFRMKLEALWVDWAWPRPGT